MINLIKNELYKILHKKSTYIVLIIILFFIILTNLIYSSDFLEIDYSIDYYKGENQYINFLEETDQTDTEEYLESKINIAKYEFAESFGTDSWQKYIILENVNFSEKVNNIISRIVAYDLNFTKDIDDYNKAKLEKDELKQYLYKTNWKDFLNQEIVDTNNQLNKAQYQEEKYLYQAKIDTLNLRLDHNIKYGYDEYNVYLNTYESNRATELSYKSTDESTLKKDEKEIKKIAIKEAETAKYKIENKIKGIPFGSNSNILLNFFDEYSFIILIMIIIVSGSIISEEFSKGTIKLLLIKPYTRTKIILSKYITVLITIFFSIIITFILQLIIGGLFFGYSDLKIPHIVYDLSINAIKEISIFKHFLLTTISTLPQFILLGTISFALSTIFTSTALSNTLTILIALGSDIVNAIAQQFEIGILKFFITLNWDWSVYLYGGISPYKGITLPLSIIVCLVYLIIILLITIIIFKRKNVKNV